MKNENLPLAEARIRRLLAVGCPVPVKNHSIRTRDLVVEVREPERTEAFDFRFSTEFVFDVSIKNTSFVPLKVEHLKGLPPWEKKNFTWLSDPRLYRPVQKAYEMESGRKIVYESVLNHRISKTEIEPGGSCEGVLLAWSIETRIPIDYLHRETFPMCIVLIDQFGRSHPSTIEVRVDRSATMRMPDPGKRGTGLYGASRASKPKAVVVNEDLRRQQREPATTGFGDDPLELQNFRGSLEKTRGKSSQSGWSKRA
jgi:hypothetical protein